MLVAVNDKEYLRLMIRVMSELEDVSREDNARRTQEVLSQIEDLFGDTIFSDMTAYAFQTGDGDQQGLLFFREAVKVVNQYGVIGWLFRMFWAAHESLADAEERSRSESVPLPGGESLDDVMVYMRELNSMASWILLRWTQDNKRTNAWARLLLSGRYSEVLDTWLPEASVVFDAKGFDEYAKDINLAKNDKGVSLAASVKSKSEDEAVQLDLLEESTSFSMEDGLLTRQRMPLIRAARQYAFDSAHIEWVISQNHGQWFSSSSTNRWRVFDYVTEKMTAVMGLGLSLALQDSINCDNHEALHQCLSVLSDFRECVRMNGIPALPIFMMSIVADMTSGGETEDNDEDTLLQSRLMAADAAGVILSWIDDAILAHDMAISLLRRDMQAYARYADLCLTSSGSS